MAINPRAKAYADNFSSVFVSRYIAAARAGRTDIIPTAIREPIVAYASGGVSRSNVDVNQWVYQTLYTHHAATGRDYPMPPDFGGGASGGGSGVWGVLKVVLVIFFTMLLSIISAANR